MWKLNFSKGKSTDVTKTAVLFVYFRYNLRITPNTFFVEPPKNYPTHAAICDKISGYFEKK